jgi:hypothetical protein
MHVRSRRNGAEGRSRSCYRPGGHARLVVSSHHRQTTGGRGRAARRAVCWCVAFICMTACGQACMHGWPAPPGCTLSHMQLRPAQTEGRVTLIPTSIHPLVHIYSPKICHICSFLLLWLGPWGRRHSSIFFYTIAGLTKRLMQSKDSTQKNKLKENNVTANPRANGAAWACGEENEKRKLVTQTW